MNRRRWANTLCLVCFSAIAGEPFDYDQQQAAKLAITYLRDHPASDHRKPNFDEPHVFALIGQFDRHFISVGFESSGNTGGSFVVLEDCSNTGHLVVAISGILEDFARYRVFVTDTIVDSRVVVPRECPGQ